MRSSIVSFLLAIAVFYGVLPSTDALAAKEAKYADQPYDVVYVRCPRGLDNVVIPDASGNTLMNWNGVNDIWVSATNNIYQLPGCDLVLHKGTQAIPVTVKPLGDPSREVVLVDCDETLNTGSICSVLDPFVSNDGRSIYYSKIEDTRSFIADYGINGAEGYLGTKHGQSFMDLYADLNDPKSGGVFANRHKVSIMPFASPICIYRFDLDTGSSKKISPECDVAEPKKGMFSGRAYAHTDAAGNPEWRSAVPVMDTGPFVLPDGRIGFTSNRENGFSRFQLFTMEADGKNLSLIGHRAMAHQLHGYPLSDGRIMYTSYDRMLQKTTTNNFSLFTVNPDGGDPFILAGENDPTFFSYHYATQLSNGDIVAAIYYNKNNAGLGTLLRFPIDPAGADFVHLADSFETPQAFAFDPSVWIAGNRLFPFSRKDQYILTEQGSSGDRQRIEYESPLDFWIHPNRVAGGRTIQINGSSYTVDRKEIRMQGRFSMPAAAPGNDLLATYAFGGVSTITPPEEWNTDLQTMLDRLGKDAGIWLFPLSETGVDTIGHIADDGLIVVDFPEYHEIMARAVVPYQQIYGENATVKKTPRYDGLDARLPEGGPYALTGASSMYDRESMAINGTPWNARDGGGVMSGRTYLNLAGQGGDLAIYDSSEIAGVRVSLPIPTYPLGVSGGKQQWAGVQEHQMRILGEFPIIKPGNVLDAKGNPDTSFVVRIPADTPFFFQAIDNRGMALNIETTSRSAARGEKQLCEGCHLHTDVTEGLDPFESYAHTTAGYYGNFTTESAPLFDGGVIGGIPTTLPATTIYDEATAPGVSSRKSFAVDWENGVSQVVDQYCSACHAEGKPAQVTTGLLLDGSVKTYNLVTKNTYVDDNGKKIDARTKPDVGLDPADFTDPSLDRIIPMAYCCLASRWLSLNSARSSMLVWALYGERLDGRDNTTGLPPVDSGVPVDSRDIEKPAIWPAVADHAAYLDGSGTMPGTVDMPESTKRLLARWIDIGAPKLNVHNDMARPVLTLTPVNSGSHSAPSITQVKVGVWDDSPIDYSRFVVRRNGSTISVNVPDGNPSVISVPINPPITKNNQDSVSFTFEIWDKPNRSLDLIAPTLSVANRVQQTISGRGLIRLLATASVNTPPTATSARCETRTAQPCLVTPTVVDPDAGDSFSFQVIQQPANGQVDIVLGQMVYKSVDGFVGRDSFVYSAKDSGGEQVQGTADIVVNAANLNTPPTSTRASCEAATAKPCRMTPIVVDPDADDSFSFEIIQQPGNGRVEVILEQMILVYTSDSNFVGEDSFDYWAMDSGGERVRGTARIVVNAVNANTPPTSTRASCEAVTAQPCRMTPIVVDPDAGDSFSFQIIQQPGNGRVEVALGQLIYTSNDNFVDEDSFDYWATDSGGERVRGTARIVVKARAGNSGESRKSSGGGAVAPYILILLAFWLLFAGRWVPGGRKVQVSARNRK